MANFTRFRASSLLYTSSHQIILGFRVSQIRPFSNGVMPKRNVLHLYRRILKAAATFPSIKREGIIKDIKIEFRENSIESDQAKVAVFHQTAQRSYSQLLTFCNLDPDDPDWSVKMSEEPMPQK